MEQWSSNPTVLALHDYPKVKACNLIIIQMLFQHWQTWGIHHLSNKPATQFDHPLSKEMFPRVQSNLHWHTLNHIHTSCLWIPGRRSQHLPLASTSSRSCREQWSHPLAPFFQTRQAQSPYLLLIGHYFQLFYRPCCFLLDKFKNFHILNCGAQTCLHYSRWGCTIAE